jgi:fructose-1,6-bisphosphatase I
MFVYSTGHGVHQFTLDQGLGEFLLAQEALQHGTDRIYSVNESYSNRWSPGFRNWIDWMKGGDAGSFSARYIGSLVADFHRGLIKGGVFAYPADEKSPSGKLRLLYECAPLAFIAEQAGGTASDGRCRILDLTPEKLHQRSPLFIGSKALVHKAVELMTDD